MLLSNVLHDWDVPECRALVGRLAEALRPGRRLLIHDVFLDDDLGGPLPVALYSASLFRLTEGRAYSADEISRLAPRGRPGARPRHPDPDPLRGPGRALTAGWSRR